MFNSAKVNSINFTAYNCVADVAQEFVNCFEKNFYDSASSLVLKRRIVVLNRRFNAAYTELVERAHFSLCQLFTIDEVRCAVLVKI